LSRISRIPESVFVEAIPRLIEIGWLTEADDDEGLAEISHDGAGISQDDASISHLPARKGREGKGKGRKKSKPKIDTALRDELADFLSHEFNSRASFSIATLAIKRADWNPAMAREICRRARAWKGDQSNTGLIVNAVAKELESDMAAGAWREPPDLSGYEFSAETTREEVETYLHEIATRDMSSLERLRNVIIPTLPAKTKAVVSAELKGILREQR